MQMSLFEWNWSLSVQLKEGLIVLCKNLNIEYFYKNCPMKKIPVELKKYIHK